jgi:peptide/nickel transport system substrate-binding protein
MHWRRLILTLLFPLGLGAGEPIRVGVSEWTTLNPLLQARETDGEVGDLVFDRLVSMDARGNFIPELLQGWTILKGGREVVLDLRPGLTWHDGKPIEAEDLVFTWKALRLPQVRAISDIAGVASMDSLRAEGPLRVRIRLAQPRGSLLADLYNFIPVPRSHYQVGAKPLESPLNFLPIGSGPYRVLERATNRTLKLQRWEGYRGPHPGTWPALEFRDPIGERQGASAILEGRYHCLGVSAFSYYLAKKGAVGGGRIQAHSAPQAAFGAYFLNCDPKRSPLGDLRVRQALAELVPWEHFARAGRFFPARLATSFWPPENWAHDPSPRPLPQPWKAAELLDAAGWRRGADGIRRDEQGNPLSLKAYETVPTAGRRMSGLLAATAAKVGLQIEVQFISFEELVARAARHDGDIWAYGWTTTLDPDVDSPLFTLDGLRTKANVSSYLNPEVDRLFQAGRHTLDQAARKQIYLKLSEVIWRDKPLIPLTYDISRLLSDRRLKGLSFNVLGQTYGFWPGRRGWSLVD